jgi:hypothetical protein
VVQSASARATRPATDCENVRQRPFPRVIRFSCCTDCALGLPRRQRHRRTNHPKSAQTFIRLPPADCSR